MAGPPDLKDVQARLEQFRDERDWAQFHAPGNLAKAIVIEAAELLELFLWTTGAAEETVLDKHQQEVEAELADVIIQCLNFANRVGIDVLDAVSRKIEVNEERYPVERARGSARKHSEL